MLDNRIIWVIRETRTGGTWFVRKLCYHLNRESLLFEENKTFTQQSLFDRDKIFEKRKEEPSDVNLILTTHSFIALKSLKNYNNPLVLRISRKNRLEQFISSVIAKKTNIWNLFYKASKNEYPNIQPFIIPEFQAIEFFNKVKVDEELWNEYCKNYYSETLFYEDLLTGFTSRLILGINNWKIEDTEDRSLTLKIPYNKKMIIKNYDKLETLFANEYG